MLPISSETRPLLTPRMEYFMKEQILETKFYKGAGRHVLYFDRFILEKLELGIRMIIVDFLDSRFGGGNTK